jgi:hypothetical protein
MSNVADVCIGLINTVARAVVIVRQTTQKKDLNQLYWQRTRVLES